jgi:hypothetical protein
MLTPTRRGFLLGALLALGATACARLAPGRPSAPPSQSTPAEFDAWNTEAQAILSDSLEALRTFDVFAAYRVSGTPESSIRLASALAWDPPTNAAWDEATHVSRGLPNRANQLFVAATTASIDQNFWREQRKLADAVADLLDLGDIVVALRDRIDVLPPGDGSGALGLLDQAWIQWEKTAARWGVSRSEPIGCTN